MAAEPSTGSSPGRSVSASSLSSSLDTSGIDVEDLDLMDCLVQDVRLLSDSLNRLSTIVSGQNSESIAGGTLCVAVHEGLTETSRCLKDLLERYLFLRCSDILSPASNLIHAVKGLKFDKSSVDRETDASYERALASISKLQAALAERVGDYLTWEMSHYDYIRPQTSEELINNDGGGGSSSTAGQQQGGGMSGSYRDVNSAAAGGMMMSGGVGGVLDGVGGMRRTSRQIHRRHSAFLPKSKLEHLSRDQMDKILLQHGNGIELAFERSKAWSKYCKVIYQPEILNFVQRRINLETEHAKQVQRLADATKSVIQDDDYMPLQDVFIKSFKQELDYVKQCNETMRNLYEYKFIKPLEGRRAEHDRKRKDLKAKWDRCVKIANDTQAELKKANENFKRREEAFVNARESSLSEESKSVKDPKAIEKKKTKEQETHQKKMGAAKHCHTLEQTLTEQMRDLERTRKQILKELGDLIMQCDQTTKACTNAYFQSLSGLWAGLPIHYQEMGHLAFEYKPGFEYNQYVQSLGPITGNNNRLGGQCMGAGGGLIGGDREITIGLSSTENDVCGIPGGVFSPSSTSRLVSLNDHHKDSFSRTPQPSRGNVNPADLTLDQDVEESLASYHRNSGDLGRLRTRTEDSGGTNTSDAGELLSTNGNQCSATHNLGKSRVPAKCAHCDSYSFIATSYCSDCHLTWHKSCLADMKQICSPASTTTRLPSTNNSNISRLSLNNNSVSVDSNRLTVFGPPLEDHLKRYGLDLPIVLTTCVQELDKRGLNIKGLYRVCGTKSKIDELCKAFERSLGETDLSEHSPATVASCLKVYFRNLPECLLTDRLYKDWMSIVEDLPKEHAAYVMENAEELKQDIKNLLNRLPIVNFNTLRYLIMHLKRITWFECENSMTAMNVGIVFGPTLLWKEKDSYIDALPQTHVVELLIRFAYDVFDVNYEDEVLEFRKNTGKTIPIDPRNLPPISVDPNQSYPESASEGEFSVGSSATGASSSTELRNTTEIITTTSLISQQSRRSQRLLRSPASSENSSTSTTNNHLGCADRRQKSATPDLLKGRLHQNERPSLSLSSPASSASQDEQSRTINDNSTSDEEMATSMIDPSSMIVQQQQQQNGLELSSTDCDSASIGSSIAHNSATIMTDSNHNRIIPKKKNDSSGIETSDETRQFSSGLQSTNKRTMIPPAQTKVLENDRHQQLQTTPSAAANPPTGKKDEMGNNEGRGGEEESESASARRRRFERGARPVRRNSRSRNYTTSIFVSPSKLEVDRRRRSSEDIPSLINREGSSSEEMTGNRNSTVEPVVHSSTIGPTTLRTSSAVNQQKNIRPPLTIKPQQSGTYIGGNRIGSSSSSPLAAEMMNKMSSTNTFTNPHRHQQSLPADIKANHAFSDSSHQLANNHRNQHFAVIDKQGIYGINHGGSAGRRNRVVGSIATNSDESEAAAAQNNSITNSPTIITASVDSDSVHILLSSSKDEELSYV